MVFMEKKIIAQESKEVVEEGRSLLVSGFLAVKHILCVQAL